MRVETHPRGVLPTSSALRGPSSLPGLGACQEVAFGDSLGFQIFGPVVRPLFFFFHSENRGLLRAFVSSQWSSVKQACPIGLGGLDN